MNIQALMDGMSAQWQRERAETQMTLGKLIDALEAMPEGAEVANLNSAHSYRGYYSDLAFERDEGTRPAADLLDECKAAMGQVFCGYKGGDFVMGALTPVWLASYSGGASLRAAGFVLDKADAGGKSTAWHNRSGRKAIPIGDDLVGGKWRWVNQ